MGAEVAALKAEVAALQGKLAASAGEQEECVDVKLRTLEPDDKNATEIIADVVRYGRRKGKEAFVAAGDKSAPHVAKFKRTVATAARDAADFTWLAGDEAMVVARGIYRDEVVPRAMIARDRAESEWQSALDKARSAYDVHVRPIFTGDEVPLYVNYVRPAYENVVVPAFDENIRPLYPNYIEPFVADIRSQVQPFFDEYVSPLYASIEGQLVPLYNTKALPFYEDHIKESVDWALAELELSRKDASAMLAGLPFLAKGYALEWRERAAVVIHDATGEVPKIASLATAKLLPVYVTTVGTLEEYVGSSAERVVHWVLAWIVAWVIWNSGSLLITTIMTAAIYGARTCFSLAFLLFRLPWVIAFKGLTLPFFMFRGRK
jgi:hypothetical protein